MEIIIAECFYCQTRRYAWSEEEAIYKLSQHLCLSTLLDKELEEILSRCIKSEEAS